MQITVRAALYCGLSQAHYNLKFIRSVFLLSRHSTSVVVALKLAEEAYGQKDLRVFVVIEKAGRLLVTVDGESNERGTPQTRQLTNRLAQAMVRAFCQFEKFACQE